MRTGLPKLTFVAIFVVNCILWSRSRYGQISSVHSISPTGQLVKRNMVHLGYMNASHSIGDEDEVRL